MNYTPLEPSFIQPLGLDTIGGGITSLLASTTFLYGAGIMLVVVAAAFRYGLAGIWRIEASSRGITKSNQEIKRVTIGLIGVLSLFLLISTVNRDLLRGDVGLSNLGGGGVTSNPTTPSTSTTPTNTNSGGTTPSTRTCEAKEATIQKLSSPGGVCGGITCTVLSGCQYATYLPILQQETSRQGVDIKIAIVIMCRESSGRKESQNRNPNGTYDCGLMQINQQTPCDATILEPATNIARGVAHIKTLTNSSSVKQVYPNIPSSAGVFASYNCCANGTVPHAPSTDCTQASGFPYTIPKWACPINPGEGTYNMCVVKGYACELSACLQHPSLQGL